jgi:electron-transferring-flavoprotein dehydrogenase
MTLTGGRLPRGRIPIVEDVERAKILRDPPFPVPSVDELAFSKVDAVFHSGNHTRDDLPPHLVVGEDLSPELAEFYEHLCPAGVYERDGDRLVVNASNCVDCKATDVLGPRWMVREGGSGPAYRAM